MFYYHKDVNGDHTHEHEHVHSHEHTHEDGTTHEHVHVHVHSHEHTHNNDHEHTHEHRDIAGHEHTHEKPDLEGLTEAEKDMLTLEHLLGHWVEHNVSHMEGFEEWAAKAISYERSDVADAIYAAIHYMQHANEELAKAKELM